MSWERWAPRGSPLNDDATEPSGLDLVTAIMACPCTPLGFIRISKEKSDLNFFSTFLHFYSSCIFARFEAVPRRFDCPWGQIMLLHRF